MRENYIVMAQHIKDYRKTHNLSLREFAFKAGVSHSYIDKIEKIGTGKFKEFEATIEVLEKIAKASDVTLASLLNKAGYISLDSIDLYKTIESLQTEIGALKDILGKEIKSKKEMSEKISNLEDKLQRIFVIAKIQRS